MKNNDSPINDYKKITRKRMLTSIFAILIIAYFAIQISKIVLSIKSIFEESQKQTQTIATIESKNMEVDLITDIEDDDWLRSGQEIEFENGITIPIPSYTGNAKTTVSWEEGIETNYIAYRSQVVKMTYNLEFATADFMLDIYGQRLTKNYGYGRVFYPDAEGVRIFTKEEVDGYFSYVILEGSEATMGICYGEPRIR